MKNMHIYIIRCTLLLLLSFGLTLQAMADGIGIRYVSTEGEFSNDGLSWATAKNNLQSAIDELYDAVRAGTITKGYVYVAGAEGDGMVYVPTRRSTDDADGSVFNTSFRIYAGISVYGGFKGDEVPTGDVTSAEDLWKLRVMTNNHTYERVESDIDADNIGETVRRWNFKYKTVLSGNHSTKDVTFRFDQNRGIYNASFPLSSYHVVWFATNGKIADATFPGHFQGLTAPAVLDGCTIKDGYASSTNLSGHEHTGYGGGVYMVKNAVLRNCVVHHCAATQRGGGVYMDGGGEVDRCYVHTSQVTGYGMQQGYGGAICIDYDGSVKHSYIIQCAARIGAGLAICHVPGEYPEATVYPNPEDRATPYDPFASAVVISNCTSNAEGAGAYLDEGGTLNHCTIVNNKCVGPDVIYYGRRHARTGGIYVRDRGTLYNTVAWGNQAPVNNDVQFASFKTTTAEAANWRIAVYHCAFSRSDITDWATATKENVVSLTNENTPDTKDAVGNFPMFNRPTAQAGIQYASDGSVDPTATGDGQPYQRVYNWHPLASSHLRQKAVQVSDALQGISQEVLHARITTDIIGRRFEAISSVGAMEQNYHSLDVEPTILPSLEQGETNSIPTLFVDPDRRPWGPLNDMEADGVTPSAEQHAGYLDSNPTGNRWEHPFGNLGNAIRTLKLRQWTSGEKKGWYNVGGTANGDGTFTGGTDYPNVQICVKEGSITTAGPEDYLGSQARTASLRPASNMRLYGGYPKSCTGTTTSGRNQRQYPTRVSANVLQSIYMNNAAHVFALINVHDVIIDGFRIYDGNANINASGTYSTEPIAYGGGIIVNNTSRPIEERQDMTGNIVRNCVIANCSAPDGAAVYVNGGNLKTDGKHCRAELSVINCVIRNNTAGDMHGSNDWFVYREGADYEDAVTGTDNSKNHKTESAVVTANGNAHIWLRNCDIMNNCGYAMEGKNSLYNPMDPSTSEGDMFQIEIYNSILFSNGQMIRNDRNGIESPVTCKWSEQRSIIGNYIYIDWDAQKPPVPDDVKCFNFLTRMRERDRKYITDNETESGTPLKSYVDVYGQQRYATEHGDIDGKPLQWRYPYFVNPSRNVGHSEDGDRPLYGGTVSYEPLNMNPIVNGGNPLMETGGDRLPVNNTMAMAGDSPATMTPVASPTNLYHANSKSMAYDAAWQSRNYGGAPDAGAVEDLRLPKGGTVIYVTPEGAGKRDGSSWSNAIQGNAVYQLDDVPGPALATGDMLDTTNGTDRVISSSGDASTAEAAVLTTDSKYCGGFGRSWFTDWKTGGTSTTTVTKTWITEKNVYVGGARNGEEEVLQDGSTPTETSETTITSSGSNPTGFTAGYHYDPRYPYGEISGGSRSFWRANPYHNGTDWNNGANYSDKDAFITACNNNGWINNSRQERYVGGLQYAVEKAAAYNALPENDANRIEDVDSIMVWVGNGKYTDYKGFVMRDKTTVTGSFPVSRGGTPGLSERQALMSDVISIPKSLPAQNFDAADYETILQISDTDPETDKETLNEEAVKYWDDDWSVLETSDTRSYEYKNRDVTNTYTFMINETDNTSTYIYNPNISSMSRTGSAGNYSYGATTAGKDCWHVSYPTSQTYYHVDISYQSNKALNVFDYDTGSSLGTQTSSWYRLGNGSLTGLRMWQTMKNVEIGTHKLTLDMMGGYRNGDPFDITTPSNIYLHILDAYENDLVDSVLLKCRDYNNPTGTNKDRIRLTAFRKTIEFTTTVTGNVTILVEVLDGTRNTKERNATYGTDDGGDPDLIPWNYKYDKGTEANPSQEWGTNNPNRREFFITNLKLMSVDKTSSYVLTNQEIVEDDADVDNPKATEVRSLNTYNNTNHRTTLRKRVLTMPDVCVPTYGAGSVGDPAVTDRGKFVDNLCHTHRVTGATKAKRTSWENSGFVKEDPNYVEYSDVFWDGFTIRHGFIADEGMAHGGGAGVNLYEGAHLQNCIVIHNMSYSARVKGGGLFCDGATSTIEGCFVLNNTSTRGTNTVQDQIFAGGMFMYEGTCFNSLFAKNYSYGSAGGLGFCVGRFYNNTIAYNTCTLKEGDQYSGGAISLATSSSPNLFVANTIIFGNNGIAIRDRNTGDGKVNPFLHCYVQSEVAQPNNATKKNVTNWTASNTGNYGIGNVFLNGVAPSADNTPFAADIASGSYDASNPGAKEANDFRLTSELQDCINKGTEDFAGNLLTALIYKGKKENEIRNLFIYKSVEASVLPENDVAFARRVQDCQIDMGAYEFDGSKFIEPDLSEDGKAIFYVSQNGGGGLATASTPADAACMLKLQKVLDAAGRWKYAANFYSNTDPAAEHYNMTNFTRSVLEDEITTAARKRGDIAANASLSAEDMATWLAGLKDRTVIVKLAGDYYRDGTGKYTPTFFKYHPTRSTVTDQNMEENLLEYSFMVPRGVQVLGGYTAEPVEKDDGSGESWPAFSDITRDALGNHTRLCGDVVNTESGTSGNTFHVVTFVEDLYDPGEKLYTNGDGTQLKGQLSVFSDEKDRAVLDGLYIQEGYANGTDQKDRQGAGAIVTDYAHIRNCIVQNNEAVGEGGGLYLLPGALVSGSIIKGNTAYAGGGLYVEEPETVTSATYARVIASTVVYNRALTVAGGIHFDTNVRANSCAFWKNTANDLSNVAGTFTNAEGAQIEENCPFNYCGVESRRMSGVNNIELPVAEGEGVRWNYSDPHEVMRWKVFNPAPVSESASRDTCYYYPINMSSVLGRAGMTYAAYRQLSTVYPTLELTDMAGLNRMEQEATATGEFIRLTDGTIIEKEVKNNAFIEMGARVMNGTFELHVNYSHVMTRLFVTTTQLLPTEAALALQQNTVIDEWQRRYPESDIPASQEGEAYEKYLQTQNDVEMYKQMGSTFLNPFHRLGDALEYIVRIRKSTDPFDSDGVDGDDTTVGDYYKNQRFEIFVSSGTFYPFRDAHGQQGEARSNTFVVPEEVTIVGGVAGTVDFSHAYCQRGQHASDPAGDFQVAGLTLKYRTTEDIRADREYMDRNGNHVKEPWELQEQTILSGNAVNNTGSNSTNVYHVITCFPDENRVGKLPSRWEHTSDVETFESTGDVGTTLPSLKQKENDSAPAPTRADLLENIERECSASRDRRTIFLDGLTITGGHANDLEDEIKADNFEKLTYFRGGGILVEGNWDNSFDQTTGLPEVLGVAKRDITLVTANCLFQDNTAANGGAVYTNGTYYAFGCHFTKNTACGPNTAVDQKFIPWTAGGAIANNYNVHVWNSLFDNNEAKHGAMAITNGTVYDAENRQGYAGAISCSETGLVRVANCDFVRNKAVAFPAIYNFFDNNLRAYSGIVYKDYHDYIDLYPNLVGTMNGGMDNLPHEYAYFKKEFDDYYYGKGHHFAVNSIFWGNEATGSTVHAASWQGMGFYNWRENGYALPANYYSDDKHLSEFYTTPQGWTDKRTPQHIANFGPFLDISTLTFCAFEEGTGREGTVWFENHDYAKTARISSLEALYAGDFVSVLDQYFGYYPDGHPENPYFRWYNKNTDHYLTEAEEAALTDLEKESGVYVKRPRALKDGEKGIPYNYNLVLDPENLDANGPYFVQPSITAGEDGYMETADWLVSRLNRTVDTGWGMLRQKVTQASATSALLSTTLLKEDQTVVDATTNQYEELWGDGFYNLHSKNIYQRFKDIGFPNLLPIGDAPYMDYTTEGTSETKNMRRISTHPKMGVQDVFIDMGIYEYQYVQLITGGSETDVIWVAETEDPSQQPCNGSTWAKATSDLQGAIETLLLSRNEHDKMIKIRGGSYHPMNMTDGNQLAFYIRVPSRSQGVVLPAGVVTADNNFAARSLTIRGGYANDHTPDDDDGEETRDVEQNPTIFEMVSEAGSTDHMLEHLFIIEDAEKKSTFVNYLELDNPDFEKTVIPIVFEGITFVNPYGNNHHEDGGAAILYEEQYRTVGSNDSYQKDPLQLLQPAPIYDGSGKETGEFFPKLIIKDCVFAANGKDHETSAVKINKGGGESLIVNSLFHSNSAAPIDAVNTKIVNCTFALNGGHITLRDETERYNLNAVTGVPESTKDFASGLYNSIVWRDDQNAANPSEAISFEVKDNAGTPFTLGTSDRITHNTYTLAGSEPDGTTVADGQHNFLMSKVNDDVLLGPNFRAPHVDIPSDYSDMEKLAVKVYMRDFHVGPSAQVLNRADVETYIENVRYTPSYPDYASNAPVDNTIDLEGSTLYAKERPLKDAEGNVVGTYWFHSVQHGNPTTLTEAMMKGENPGVGAYQEHDLAYKPRWLNMGLERGAYECTAAVERVLYVMDGASGDQDGTTWEHAFEIDDLQKAVDVASVYSLTTSPQERAYVFVKASDTPVDALKLRDGVSVFGGISGSFSEEVVKVGDHYEDADIEAYILQMDAMRSGIATRNVTHNTIRGLKSENNTTFNSGFLLDGFWLSSGATAQTPVNMVKENTVVRNSVITGCNVTGDGLPVIDLQKGLLYNTLVYGNTPGDGAPVVSIGADGYALNNTIVASAAGQTPLSVLSGFASHAQNNIAVNEASGEGGMFAPYLRDANAYTPADWMTDHQPYWYQLHEQTSQINSGTDDGTTAKSGGNEIAARFADYVNFDRDRDLLGNPRRLGGRVDNGCYETWKVEGNRLATNVTNPAFTDGYGGHRYPHPGSVVYVMENANLVFGLDGDDNPLFTTTPVQPGYVLMKEGASIYGQGNLLQFRYVAAERSFGATDQYRLMAFPFDVRIGATVSVTGSETLTQVNKSSYLTPYTYNSAGRAAWNYDFKADNSALWVPITMLAGGGYTQRAATEGWLLELSDEAVGEQTLRFTGWGSNENSFVYTENGTNKTVTLTQYNSNSKSATNYPQFTKSEDMGWNLKGQPWLVSRFATGGDNPYFKMDVPHLFYAMSGNGDYAKAAGQLYTSRSWDTGAGLDLGDGFFTQTAIIGTEETLTFQQPVYGGTEPVAPARPLVGVYEDDCLVDYVELHPTAGASADMPFHMGSDGVKWMAFSDATTNLFVHNADGTALSLIAEAPTETEIPLGLRTRDGEQLLTIALPSREAFEGYDHVWLTDHQLNRVTDLLTASYTLTVSPVSPASASPAFTTARLTLRIGGLRPDGQRPDDDGGIRIYTRRNRLFIEGLSPGDHILVYTAGGAMVESCRATDTTWQRDLYLGTYVVRVGNTVKKVLTHY